MIKSHISAVALQKFLIKEKKLGGLKVKMLSLFLVITSHVYNYFISFLTFYFSHCL